MLRAISQLTHKLISGSVAKAGLCLHRQLYPIFTHTTSGMASIASSHILNVLPYNTMSVLHMPVSVLTLRPY